MKKVGKILLLCLLLGILVSPVAALFAVSRLEKAQYSQVQPVVLEEVAYGDLCPVERMNMAQTVTATDCSVISTAVKFIELKDYPDPYSIRFLVDTNQLLLPGDVIGYYQGEPILAQESGFIQKISLGQESYIQLDSPEDLAISCYVDETTFRWDQENLQLTLGEDVFQVASLRREPDGRLKATLTSQTASLVYGKHFDSLTFQTGLRFDGTLVVDERCVYTRNEKTYVRTVSEYGKFLQEVEVVTGYSDGTYICITPAEGNVLEENTLCDAGYKMIVESGEGNE